MTTLLRTISKLKLILLLLFTVFTAIVIYYSIEIIKARYKTAEIVKELSNPEIMKLELDDFSSKWLEILLQVEDPNFYNHKGFDFSTPGSGLTTITQGLVKIYYFRKFKPGLAKIKQTLIARFALDPLIAKDDQLRLFINRVYLGHDDSKPVYGFSRASEVYFSKQFNELELDEYIALVAMIVGPNAMSIKYHPEVNAERVRRIKRLISGNCVPVDWRDVWLEGCSPE